MKIFIEGAIQVQRKDTSHLVVLDDNTGLFIALV